MNYFLLLLPALVLVALGFLVRRRTAFWGQALIVVGCLGCVGVMVWQIRQSLFPPEAKVPSRAHSVVGFSLANQVLPQVEGRQGTIVMIFPPKSLLDEDTLQDYVNTFSPPLLRGHPELQVQPVRLELPAKTKSFSGVPVAAFQQVLSKFPNALAFVAYTGVPAEIDQIFPPESQNCPAFYLFDSEGSTHWFTALKKGYIRSVILPRPGIDAATRDSVAGDPGFIFSQLYLMATPGTADQVAASLGTK